MGLIGAALAVYGIMQVGQQVSSGYAARGEAQISASRSESQAEFIEAQKSIEGYQFDRLKNQYLSTIMARTGKAGLSFSGSPMSVYSDVATQIEMDKLVGRYNLEFEKQYALTDAEGYRRQGRAAVDTGYSNAFSTLLQTGFMVGSRLPGKTRTYATVAGRGRIEVAPPDFYLGGARGGGKL